MAPCGSCRDSHRHGMVEHRDTWRESNQLSRGQELAVDVDEEQAVDVELKSGEMSLHHGSLYHSSPGELLAIEADRPGPALHHAGNEAGGGARSTMRRLSGARTGSNISGPSPKPVFDLDPAGLRPIDTMLREMNAFYFAGAEERAPEFGVRHVRNPQDS